MSKYQITIMPRLRWYWMRLHGRYDYPRPSIIIPLDGWITDPNEILQAIVDDGGRIEYRSKSDD